MYEIIDDNGVIHSGSEEEMTHAFDVMINPTRYRKNEFNTWWVRWEGDLKLVHVILVER